MADMENTEIVDGQDESDLPIEEGTQAANTLKPGAGSGGTDSKAATLATFTSLLAQLGKEDLSKLFNDVQSQFGPNKAPGAKDNSGSNKASVNAKSGSAAVGSGGPAAADPMPKLSVKEDIDDMFQGDELSEELKEKAEVVFEAALATRITLETARLEEEFEAKEAALKEEYEQKLQEDSAAIFEELTGKLDQYLDYVTEQWMEENKLAIENSLRADIAENFIQGLHNLFAESYIRVPDEKIDLVAELKAELDEVKGKLNEAVDAKLELEGVITEATREAILDELSEGLVETQADKLRTFAEGTEFTDADSFRKKIAIIKENYFGGATKPAAPTTGLINEEIANNDDVEEAVPAHMSAYVQAISKAAK